MAEKKKQKPVTKKQKDNVGGRPTKYKEEYVKLCVLPYKKGSTDKEVGEMFGVSDITIWNWSCEYPDFFKARAAAKKFYVKNDIENALIKNCLGYRATEKEYKVIRVLKEGAKENENGDYTDDQYEDKDILTKTVIKDVGGNVAAQKFALEKMDPETYGPAALDINVNTVSPINIVLPDNFRVLKEKEESGKAKEDEFFEGLNEEIDSEEE